MRIHCAASVKLRAVARNAARHHRQAPGPSQEDLGLEDAQVSGVPPARAPRSNADNAEGQAAPVNFSVEFCPHRNAADLSNPILLHRSPKLVASEYRVPQRQSEQLFRAQLMHKEAVSGPKHRICAFRCTWPC